MSPAVKPTLRFERELLRAGHRLVAGVDEVGRGAIAGPVSVGVVVVDECVRSAPTGLRDSKMLSPAARARLEPVLQRWAKAWAIGHAEAHEIDRIGIIAALRLAAVRAFAQLPLRADVAILDGNHNYLATAVQATLFDDLTPADEASCACLPPVSLTRIRADQTCSAVAAASVLAKCQRDRMMVARHAQYPGYHWDQNKGYAAADHQAALVAHGPCPGHRLSWRITGGAADKPAPR
jgi:ribonuclease HII